MALLLFHVFPKIFNARDNTASLPKSLSSLPRRKEPREKPRRRECTLRRFAEPIDGQPDREIQRGVSQSKHPINRLAKFVS
ncbi:hypothetical protein KPH14_005517 [Odynerus spinipes]|uniref:Uncharacterized protein n=1 Tax=Odynerus spinipes TaxID=1348599 RepID=A0AAD9RBX3_9HYME|nr:hypothetical protein KPH14_005517 [Odynerus spinipes]